MNTLPDPFPTLNKHLEDQEYEYLRRVMIEADGRVKVAARLAGREFRRFYRKLLAYGIKARAFRKRHHCDEWYVAQTKKGKK